MHHTKKYDSNMDWKHIPITNRKYNITVKKDNWDKSSRESIKRRRPNDKEKTDLLKALEDKEKFSEIVKRNDEILNNITKYIEDNTNKKNKDLK